MISHKPKEERRNMPDDLTIEPNWFEQYVLHGARKLTGAPNAAHREGCSRANSRRSDGQAGAARPARRRLGQEIGSLSMRALSLGSFPHWGVGRVPPER